ncbi:MAG: DUF4080 domain-containing protein, partial [Tissierellaceae bacterium]
SSTIKGLRFFQLDRVKAELGRLIEAKVRQVKFVDRTFNADKEFAIEVMNFLIEKNPDNINFHFEVTAHLLDQDTLDFLSTVREGLFQFEIGVQSTNPDTIRAVGRTTDFPRLRQVTKRIRSYKNIHQHLDLIAGLPYEDYNSFRKSFNDVYEIRPEKIQLGFLKLLKGTALRADEEKYGFKYLDLPPYEILENNYISYSEILKLKTIEDLVEKYYNEGYFENSLEYLIVRHFDSPFQLYENLADFWEKMGYLGLSVSRTKLYEILIEFHDHSRLGQGEIFSELVRYDFLVNNKNGKLPSGMTGKKQDISQKDKHKLLKDHRLIDNYLLDYKDMPTKRLIQDVEIESFIFDILRAIGDNYDIENDRVLLDETRILLFLYQDGVINRCKTYDITKIARELI